MHSESGVQETAVEADFVNSRILPLVCVGGCGTEELYCLSDNHSSAASSKVIRQDAVWCLSVVSGSGKRTWSFGPHLVTNRSWRNAKHAWRVSNSRIRRAGQREVSDST